MSDINWRIWLYDRLASDPTVTELVSAESIYGGGSLTGTPEEKPFIVIAMGDEFSEFPGVSQQSATLFFHDEPGNFLRIGDVQQAVKKALCGPSQRTGPAVVQGGIAVRWESDGPDQSDEGYGTLMRNSQYQLVGRNGIG